VVIALEFWPAIDHAPAVALTTDVEAVILYSANAVQADPKTLLVNSPVHPDAGPMTLVLIVVVAIHPTAKAYSIEVANVLPVATVKSVPDAEFAVPV